jgi:hypothetical protein
MIFKNDLFPKVIFRPLISIPPSTNILFIPHYSIILFQLIEIKYKNAWSICLGHVIQKKGEKSG